MRIIRFTGLFGYFCVRVSGSLFDLCDEAMEIPKSKDWYLNDLHKEIRPEKDSFLVSETIDNCSGCNKVSKACGISSRVCDPHNKKSCDKKSKKAMKYAKKVLKDSKKVKKSEKKHEKKFRKCTNGAEKAIKNAKKAAKRTTRFEHKLSRIVAVKKVKNQVAKKFAMKIAKKVARKKVVMIIKKFPFCGKDAKKVIKKATKEAEDDVGKISKRLVMKFKSRAEIKEAVEKKVAKVAKKV